MCVPCGCFYYLFVMMAASPQEEDIDNELLIEEVEKRPALYDKKLKEYSDINVKRRLWSEIVIQSDTNFDSKRKYRPLLEEGRNTFFERPKASSPTIQKGIIFPFSSLVTVVQRRWKNLRACFSRELRSQKEVKSGQAAPKRKRYVYYEKLLFLIPSMDQPNETFSNTATAPVNEDNEALGEDESSSSSTVTRRAQEKKKKNKTYEESLLEILKKKSNNTVTDPENHFALSLVPMCLF
ncbi:hypothetical protein ACJJTC_003937 [Scirpophaga incertulas]